MKIRDFKLVNSDNLHKVNWVWISKNQNISEDFIREFQDKVKWRWISQEKNLSEDFIQEFKKNWE